MSDPDKPSNFVISKIILIILLSALGILVALSVMFATDVYLLVFLGILFAVFLVQTTVIVQRFIPLSYKITLAIVTSILFATAVGVIIYSGSSIETQLAKTTKELSRSKDEIKGWLEDNPHTMALIGRVPFADRILNLDSNQGPNTSKSSSNSNDSNSAKPGGGSGSLLKEIEAAIAGESSNTAGEKPNPSDELNDNQEKQNSKNSGSDEATTEPSKQDQTSSSSNVPSPNLGKLSQQASKVTGSALTGVGNIFSKTFGLLASVGLIIFVGLFIAVDPALYRDGFVKLLLPRHRSRAVEVMDKIGLNLFNWLNGRFIAMLITGAGTGLGLWFLGVPLAIVVGVVTALMTFIPNIGGFVALMLAMLMGLPQGPSTVVWIVILYGTLQLIESNIITPLVQQQKTSIPPALLLAFQLLLGALTGFLGLLVATPMLAGLMVFVKEVWISDVLGDDDIQTPELD